MFKNKSVTFINYATEATASYELPPALPCRLDRYYKLSVLLMCFLVPMFVPWHFWGESLWVAYFIPALLRYALVLHASWLVNSAAHMWGNRPYDKTINPRENRFVAFSAIGMKTHKRTNINMTNTFVTLGHSE